MKRIPTLACAAILAATPLHFALAQDGQEAAVMAVIENVFPGYTDPGLRGLHSAKCKRFASRTDRQRGEFRKFPRRGDASEGSRREEHDAGVHHLRGPAEVPALGVSRRRHRRPADRTSGRVGQVPHARPTRSVNDDDLLDPGGQEPQPAHALNKSEIWAPLLERG